MSYLSDHWNELFVKYSPSVLMKDISSFQDNSGSDLEKVLHHFFTEEIFKCRSGKAKYTPIEFLSNDEAVHSCLRYIASKPVFFDEGSEIENIKLFIRKGPAGICRKVANFSPRIAREIYFRYFPEFLNGYPEKRINCLDTSCGFGARMSAVLLTGANYYGFDPNLSLCEKLFECESFYRSCGAVSGEQICKVNRCGSEIFIPEYENMMDVSFTSPPYFDYETYSDDGYASSKSMSNLRNWVGNFLVPTVDNTVRYIKPGGYIMLNTADKLSGTVDLFSIWKRAFQRHHNLEFVEDFRMHSRKSTWGYDEPVMVFRKVR